MVTTATVGRRSNRFLSVGIVFFILFTVVTVLVFSNLTQGFDASIAEQINGYLGKSFTSLMVYASLYGREYFWIGIVFLMLVFGNKNTKLLAIELAALFVAGVIAGEVAKLVAFRERPYSSLGSFITLRMAPDTDSSFPSGHAVIVSIGAIFALIKFGPGFKKRIVALLLTLEAAIVCYSRVYVGLHYPLDVLGGIFLAGGIVCVGIYLIERYLPRLFLKIAGLFDYALRRLRIPEVI